ncbi:MAG: sugar phosphate isomerase/epimerase family protein [Bryobacteraceae bacterium]
MRRRDFLPSICAAAVAMPRTAVAAADHKPRFRPAICAYSFRDQLKDKSMNYADVIHVAADVGADGVDLTTYWFADTNDDTLFALKKVAYQSAISIYNLGVRARMAQPTAELRAAEVATVRKWLDVAQRLGAGHIRVFGGAVPKGATEDQAVAWAVETLKPCADEAAKKGIILGVEDDGGITTTAERTVEIFKKTDSPWVGINLDVGNFPNDGYNQIALCAPFATNVHFKSEVHIDHKNVPADWPRILGILSKSGYRGYLALEYELTEHPQTMVPQLMAKMREVIRASETR